MFLKMTVGPKRNCTGITPVGPLHVVDVHVDAQLGLTVELLVAYAALALPIVISHPVNVKNKKHRFTKGPLSNAAQLSHFCVF